MIGSGWRGYRREVYPVIAVVVRAIQYAAKTETHSQMVRFALDL